jgi:hypothetical protein
VIERSNACDRLKGEEVGGHGVTPGFQGDWGKAWIEGKDSRWNVPGNLKDMMV